MCELTATATLHLLTDGAPDRAASGPNRCSGGWLAIRKHVRRARGAACSRVAALDGVTVARDGAEVRALLPYPLDALPRDLARLQLEASSWMTRPAGRASTRWPMVRRWRRSARTRCCPRERPRLRPPMRRSSRPEGCRPPAWRGGRRQEFPVTVEHPDPDRWPRLRATAPVEIVDAGYTVVEPNTTTALARWA
ncbi:MAG: hypothetical protein R2755_33265 [Acidimicrobiales bacterium]